MVLEITAALFYIAILLYVWRQLTNADETSKALFPTLLLAIALHGYVSYLGIDGGEGHNLSLLNIFVMTTWISMIVVLWDLYKHKANALLLISLPVAAVSLLEVAFIGKSELAQTNLNQNSVDLLHILLGVGAMSVLLLAALQSVLVLYIDHGLRSHPVKIPSWLGPLRSLERYLIQLIIVGFLLMSSSLALALFLPTESTSSQPLHKIVLTVFSWAVIGVLIFGHFVRGWRGVFAAKLTLLGVFLLLLGYFGSKLVLEYILTT